MLSERDSSQVTSLCFIVLFLLLFALIYFTVVSPALSLPALGRLVPLFPDRVPGAHR